jgi:hypothetical protein
LDAESARKYALLTPLQGSTKKFTSLISQNASGVESVQQGAQFRQLMARLMLQKYMLLQQQKAVQLSRLLMVEKNLSL